MISIFKKSPVRVRKVRKQNHANDSNRKTKAVVKQLISFGTKATHQPEYKPRVVIFASLQDSAVIASYRSDLA
jgi:hypothetical protein